MECSLYLKELPNLSNRLHHHKRSNLQAVVVVSQCISDTLRKKEELKCLLRGAVLKIGTTLEGGAIFSL